MVWGRWEGREATVFYRNKNHKLINENQKYLSEYSLVVIIIESSVKIIHGIVVIILENRDDILVELFFGLLCWHSVVIC